MTDDDQRYSEDEVALILRRAAELQPGSAMSLAEIESVADEAGIEPALVRRAADEVALAKREPTPAPATLGSRAFGPMRVVYERSVPGTATPAMWPDIIGEVRRHLSMTGTAEEIGKELIWSSRARDTETRQVRVIVTPRAGRTLVRVEEHNGPLAGGLYGGIIGGAGSGGLGWILPVCIAVLHMPILIPVLFAAWVYATYLLSRTIFRNVVANRQPQLRALSDSVAELTGELIESSEPPAR